MKSWLFLVNLPSGKCHWISPKTREHLVQTGVLWNAGFEVHVMVWWRQAKFRYLDQYRLILCRKVVLAGNELAKPKRSWLWRGCSIENAIPFRIIVQNGCSVTLHVLHPNLHGKSQEIVLWMVLCNSLLNLYKNTPYRAILLRLMRLPEWISGSRVLRMRRA